jgi:glycosyltransferase involved in cell wall biosynthesis
MFSVSVIIPYYNKPEFIEEAVRSAQGLRGVHGEIIIVDDGSREDAQDALLQLHGVTVIHQANGGVAAARNRGLAAATGEYVIFLDQDDRLLPDAATAHFEAMRRRPGAGIAFGAIRRINERGEVCGSPYVCSPRRSYFTSMLESNLIQCPAAAMIDRNAILSVGGLDQNVAPGDDHDLYLRLARKYPVARHTSLVADYRAHGDNQSGDLVKMLAATNRVLDKTERTMALNARERRHIQMGRTRALVYHSTRGTLKQKLQLLYFKLRSAAQTFVA